MRPYKMELSPSLVRRGGFQGKNKSDGVGVTDEGCGLSETGIFYSFYYTYAQNANISLKVRNVQRKSFKFSESLKL